MGKCMWKILLIERARTKILRVQDTILNPDGDKKRNLIITYYDKIFRGSSRLAVVHRTVNELIPKGENHWLTLTNFGKINHLNDDRQFPLQIT